MRYLLKASILKAAAWAALLFVAFPLHADEQTGPSTAELEARAERLRAEIPDLAHLVRTTPNIYLVRIESIETPKPGMAKPGDGDEPKDKVTAVVRKTLKGERAKKLTLTLRQRPPGGAAAAGFFGGGLAGKPQQLHKSPVFYAPDRFLSPRNPMFAGPLFEQNGNYLLFTDINNETLLGGPYGWQPVDSEQSVWVQTVKRLIANPDSEHGVEMSYREFITRHRSAFLMVVEDCLGTEVSLSEPLWGEEAGRDEIDPAMVLPESAEECEGALDQKRGYLGLIEAKPWLYQVRRGYPNQNFIEIRDGMLDFSELGLDIGFPDGGKISVGDLAERMSGG
ncbi:MAG: hypothetical protein ACLFV8_12595 [Alphaproteobacteria bacterium]